MVFLILAIKLVLSLATSFPPRPGERGIEERMGDFIVGKGERPVERLLFLFLTCFKGWDGARRAIGE